MRLIGVLGGMGWQSSAVYYRLLNEGVRQRLGRSHSARVLLHSLDFESIAAHQESGDGSAIGALLADAAQGLERAGAELWLVACNTVHDVVDRACAAVAIPFLHIADPVADALAHDGVRRVGILGTRHTMEAAFYRDRLARGCGAETLVPDADERAWLHGAIVGELVAGVVRDGTRRRALAIAARLAQRGAEAVVLACTELSLLFPEADPPATPLGAPRLYDGTRLHVERALACALER